MKQQPQKPRGFYFYGFWSVLYVLIVYHIVIHEWETWSIEPTSNGKWDVHLTVHKYSNSHTYCSSELSYDEAQWWLAMKDYDWPPPPATENRHYPRPKKYWEPMWNIAKADTSHTITGRKTFWYGPNHLR